MNQGYFDTKRDIEIINAAGIYRTNYEVFLPIQLASFRWNYLSACNSLAVIMLAQPRHRPA